jgi:hypothetical protein
LGERPCARGAETKGAKARRIKETRITKATRGVEKTRSCD